MTDSTFHQLYTADQKRTTPTKPTRLPKRTRAIPFPVHHRYRTKKARNRTGSR